MTITDCVRMALSKANKRQTEMVEYWGFSTKQAMHNKFIRGSWSAEDLVKLADFTGGKLMLVYPDGQQILILSEEKKPLEENPEA